MNRSIIHRDGVDWPLQTFLDAYGFLPVGHSPGSLADSDRVVEAVTSSGELITGTIARHLPWHDVVAVRGRDGEELERCGRCLSIEELNDFGWCDECWDWRHSDDGEPDPVDTAALQAADRATAQAVEKGVAQ